MLNLYIDSFAYREKEILNSISFDLQPGEHLAVLGESGCGKSTLLHLIYGLLHLENGQLSWNGKALLGPQHNIVPGEPFIKLVAQEFNVMPFISAAENIATHLPRVDLEEDKKRVHELLQVVDLVNFSEEKVKNLSGGQKQRVALAKALAKEPELLLLDEPFSNIDSFRKNKLRRNLFSYLKAKNIACITATHDSEEALAFSDTVLLLKNGKTEVLGSPQNVYSNLSNEYRASFFGEVTTILVSEGIKFLLPHQLRISIEKTPYSAIVIASYFKGSHFLIYAEMLDGTSIYMNHQELLAVGKSFYFTF